MGEPQILPDDACAEPRVRVGLQAQLVVAEIDFEGMFAMKLMTTWSVKPGALREAVGRFLAGQAAPGEGVTLLGRWHNVDLSAGYSLYETNDPAALHRSAAPWAEILDLKTVLVIEDSEAGPNLALAYKK